MLKDQFTTIEEMLILAAKGYKKPLWLIRFRHDSLINYTYAALELHNMKVDWKWRNELVDVTYEEVMGPLYELRTALESYLARYAKRKTYRGAVNVRQVIELYSKVDNRIIGLESSYSRHVGKH